MSGTCLTSARSFKFRSHAIDIMHSPIFEPDAAHVRPIVDRLRAPVALRVALGFGFHGHTETRGSPTACERAGDLRWARNNLGAGQECLDLVQGCYILREVDPEERRTNTLQLTEKGRALLSDVHKAWRAVDKIIQNAVGAENAEQLASLAFMLRDALGGRPPAKALGAGKPHRADVGAQNG